MVFMEKNLRDAFKNASLNYIGDREIWAFHPRSEFLLVSNTGKLKNIVTKHEYSSFPNQQGYMMANVNYIDGTRKCSMIHRLVMETFCDCLNVNTEFYEVNHIDGNKKNNNFSNLEWVTRQENLKHARENNLFKASNKKLTLSDINDIIEFKKLGFKVRDIAMNYKISERYVSFLTNKKANGGKYE